MLYHFELIDWNLVSRDTATATLKIWFEIEGAGVKGVQTLSRTGMISNCRPQRIYSQLF